MGTDLGDRLGIAVHNGIWDGCSSPFLPGIPQRVRQNTTVPAPVGSLSLHTHAGCVSVLDRENRAPAVEFRSHLAGLRTQTLLYRMVTELFSLPQAITETRHTDIVK